MISTFKYHLRNIITLRYFSSVFSGNLFFIFGCQRSGTTLLLSILNAHPQITCVDETEFPSPYPFPSAQRLAINKINHHYLCFKILEHSHKLDFLKKFYPNSKILWPIRNPHSAISSMLNLVNSEGDWIDRCVIKEIERLKPFFGKELENWHLSQLSKIELAGIYWLYKNQYPILLKNNGFDVLEFQYEELIQNQKETLAKITNFLEIEWSDDLLNFHQKNPSKSLAGGTRTDRPINTTRASNLQGKLNAEEIQKINVICQPVMQKYSYTEL
ncbi:MAG: sulfotransferase [Okeania sp. SIO3H1]|nr:sulfotransferase [Okeania sp. SIO3H1]